MGHHNQSAGEIQQKVLQPVDRPDIQVVGRLVHQQDGRLAKQCLGQQHLHLLAAFKVRHLHVVIAFIQPQSLEQACRLVLRFPAVELRKLSFQLGGQHPVLLGKIRFGVQGFLLLHDLIQAGIAHNHGFQHLVLIVLELILLEHRHPVSGRNFHCAGGGLQLPGENPQKGGFTGAIGSHHAVAVAGDKFQVCACKQLCTAESQADVCNCDHSFCSSIIPVSPLLSGEAHQTRIVYHTFPEKGRFSPP